MREAKAYRTRNTFRATHFTDIIGRAESELNISRLKENLSMTDEERNRAIDFIVDQQAKNSVRIERLIEAHEKAERRLDRDENKLERLERILKLMIKAGRRERRTRSEADERLTNALLELAEAHKQTEASIAHTDGRLDALIDIVRQRMNGQ
jgi:hypothetical protein